MSALRPASAADATAWREVHCAAESPLPAPLALWHAVAEAIGAA